MTWLDDGEMRVGLGCMRLADDERGRATLVAALEAGVTVLDTAHAYLGNEALLASVLASHATGRRARVVTKAGMARPGGGWRPDGRASAIRRDCEESLRALGDGGIDLVLLHAPDPKVPWKTSLRALRKLVDEGLVPRVGVSNVTLGRLDEAMDEAPITAVEVELSPFEDAAILGGVVGRSIERGLWVIAHSPLGGPERASRIDRDETIRSVAERLGASPQAALLAGLLALSDRIVPIPGATRPETARDAAGAARLVLGESDREILRTRLRAGAATVRPAPRATSGQEVVVLAGLPGAGKSTLSADYVARGYERISRDDRGGSLRATARVLDRLLGEGTARILLDATYATRASRREVLEAAWKHGAAVRCVFLETPLPKAQANVVLRMLGVHGRLLEPDEMEKGRAPDTLAPRHFYRMVRALEPPTIDEGFSALDVALFERRGFPERSRTARFVSLGSATAAPPGDEDAVFFYGFAEGRDVEAIEAAVRARHPDARIAWCRHGGGPPICWCRPPLPGLVLALAHDADVDPTRSVVVGTEAIDRKLAEAIGATFERA